MQFNILGSNIKLDKVHAFFYFMYLCGIYKSVWPLLFLCGLGLSSIPGAHSLMCGGLQKWWGEAWNLSPPVSLQCLCFVRWKPQQLSKQLSTHTHSYCKSIHIQGVLNILHNRHLISTLHLQRSKCTDYTHTHTGYGMVNRYPR